MSLSHGREIRTISMWNRMRPGYSFMDHIHHIAMATTHRDQNCAQLKDVCERRFAICSNKVTRNHSFSIGDLSCSGEWCNMVGQSLSVYANGDVPPTNGSDWTSCTIGYTSI